MKDFRTILLTGSAIMLLSTAAFAGSFDIAGGDLKDMYHARAQSGTRASDFFNFEFVRPQANFGVERAFQQPMTGQLDIRVSF